MWKPKTAQVAGFTYTVVRHDEGFYQLRKKQPVGQVRYLRYLIRRFIRWNMETICTG